MRVLWDGKTYLKRTAVLITKQTGSPLSGLSNEMLCILAAHRTSKLREVKVGGLKKWELSFT